LREAAFILELLGGTALYAPGSYMIQAVKAFFQRADVDTRPVSYHAANDATRLTDEHEAYRWVDSQGFLALPSAPYLQRLVAQAIP